MGAPVLVIAAAFAVAFAMLVSAPTQTAEATVQSRDGATFTAITLANGAAPANNGDTVYVQNGNTGFTTFEITTTGAASASFTGAGASEDGQSITCAPASAAGTCDADIADAGSTVAVKIDDDSGAGVIFVKQTNITGTNGTTTDAIRVTVAQVPTRITLKAASTSINSGQGGATAGNTIIDIRLIDEIGGGIANEDLTVVSTRALLSAAASPHNAIVIGGTGGDSITLDDYTGGQLAGSVETSDDADVGGTADTIDSRGYARVVVTGGGNPGISTITVTHGDVSASIDIVLHGTVKTIEASLEQGAIQIGGMTRVVVTALDAAGNPVKNARAGIKAKGGITAPTKGAVPVVADDTVRKDVPPVGGAAAGKGDLPACGTEPARVDDTDTADVDESGWWTGSGTNDDGKCVIQISAPNPAGTDGDAARGAHTILVVAGTTGASPPGVNEVSLELQVGGPPVAIESDAPARLESSGELTINVTVLDDEGVRVGVVAIEVDQTAGDGKIITDIADNTTDGRAKFTYLAPSTPGLAEFLVRTRDVDGKVTAQLPIIVAIGPAAVEAPPEAPSLSRAPSSTGFTLVTFSGGSVDDLSDALTAACGDGVRAWATDYQGNYVSFFPSAPAVVNSGFNALFSDGVPANEPLLVGNCGG
ncbi:MAG: hypothetical protein OXG95_09145 [Chloroflexi bacterium]|nr:hypothetical protein [Chloroflexota bacterium]